jgi:hypothetical protein
LYLFKDRLEAIEVLAFLSVRNLFSSAFLGAGADMAKFGDVGRARRASQFGKLPVLVNRPHGRDSSTLCSGQQP